MAISTAIDAVVLRDRDVNAAWGAASNTVLESRVHFYQNWRGDVSKMNTDGNARFNRYIARSLIVNSFVVHLAGLAIGEPRVGVSPGVLQLMYQHFQQGGVWGTALVALTCCPPMWFAAMLSWRKSSERLSLWDWAFLLGCTAVTAASSYMIAQTPFAMLYFNPITTAWIPWRLSVRLRRRAAPTTGPVDPTIPAGPSSAH